MQKGFYHDTANIDSVNDTVVYETWLIKFPPSFVIIYRSVWMSEVILYEAGTFRECYRIDALNKCCLSRNSYIVLVSNKHLKNRDKSFQTVTTEVTDEPGYPRNLIGVFSVRMRNDNLLIQSTRYPLSAQ